MDSRIDLQQPILDGGIRSINFFNGRLLSARDLTREQSAYREADRRLGQAVGEGIAYGLALSKSPDSTQESPVVTVESGLAVNRLGQTLMLTGKTDIALVRRASAGAGTSNAFGQCIPLQSGTYVAGAGVYLLTLAPAQGVEGRAITNGLDSATASCNTDTLVTAVQFRLIQLDPPITAAELQDQDHLRNLIAYKCFGISDTESFISDPFGAQSKQYGLLDGLRGNLLTDCDVPLGVLYWTLDDGIKFVDMWSVRRRLMRRSSLARWTMLLDERRAAEGEAMFHQFQEQALELATTEVNPGSVVATEYFGFLPSVGALPLSTASGQGFDYPKFFQGVTCREPVYLEGARVETLLRDSWSYAPVDLSSGGMFWLYWVRENAQAILDSPTPIQTCLLFASGQMPFAAAPRFDVARWNYSNFVSPNMPEQPKGVQRS